MLKNSVLQLGVTPTFIISLHIGAEVIIIHTDLEAGAVRKKRTRSETNSIIKVAHQVTRIH